MPGLLFPPAPECEERGCEGPFFVQMGLVVEVACRAVHVIVEEPHGGLYAAYGICRILHAYPLPSSVYCNSFGKNCLQERAELCYNEAYCKNDKEYPFEEALL